MRRAALSAVLAALALAPSALAVSPRDLADALAVGWGIGWGSGVGVYGVCSRATARETDCEVQVLGKSRSSPYGDFSWHEVVVWCPKGSPPLLQLYGGRCGFLVDGGSYWLPRPRWHVAPKPAALP